MRSPAAYKQTVAGLRLLELASGADLAGLQLAAAGRPMLAGGPWFSISHAGVYVVCAISEAPLGVDLERVRPLATKRVLRLLSAHEAATARREPRAFFRFWTAREAAVKASGRVGLRRLAAVRLQGDIAHIDGATLWLQRHHIDPGYELCVASPARLEVLSPQDLSAPARKNNPA